VDAGQEYFEGKKEINGDVPFLKPIKTTFFKLRDSEV
jgi:hypothetical protein